LTKLFVGFLGEENKSEWAKSDPTEIIATLKAEDIPFDDILIDVGTSDTFMDQLLPQVMPYLTQISAVSFSLSN